MNCYTYDKETLEFLGAYPVDYDPVELKKGNEVPLLPAYSTLVTVPDYKENTIPVFKIETSEWEVLPDYRKGFKKTDENFNITDIRKIGDVEEGFYVITDELAKEIQENPDLYKVAEGKVVKKTAKEYKAEQTQIRKEDFEKHFFETSLGWYRQEPSGYANAPQSIQVVDSFVFPETGLTQELADMIIFYKKPNFNKEEQCTEEWLVANQYKAKPMSYTDWKAFCLDFQKRWALLNYMKQNS